MGLFVFDLSHRLVWVFEIELSHLGKNNGNPDLVCENMQYSRFKHIFSIRVENCVDLNQMASSEASLSGSSVLKKDKISAGQGLNQTNNMGNMYGYDIIGQTGVTLTLFSRSYSA